MKKIRAILTVISLFAGFSLSGQISASGTAYTEIVPLSTVREEMQLSLGRFSIQDDGGTITIKPDGTRISSGSVVTLEGSVSQGVFVVKGAENNSVNIILPATPVTLFHQNSSNTILLENWTKSISRIDPGTIIINIGATLRLRSTVFNPSGYYTGRYQINILYN